MDPLTHTATGIFLSRAGLSRWTPAATPILILAANAPDVDILAAAGGSLNYLHYHRHITHSLAALPVLALASAGLTAALWPGKKIRWPGAFWAALIAAASHLLLDLTNSYGVRLFLPFSSRWFHLDITNVADLWIWSVILLCFLGPVISRLVSAEISSGSAKVRHAGRGFALFGLVFLCLYDSGRGVLHARAVAVLDSRLYQGAIPLRVAALPDASNPFHWRGVVETSHFFAVQDVNLWGDFDPARAAIFYKPPAGPELQAARRTETFRIFLGFSQLPLWQVFPAPEPEGGKLVEVFDLRFGSPTSPGFHCGALFNSQTSLLHTFFSFGTFHPR
jgi:inner membrane protein